MFRMYTEIEQWNYLDICRSLSEKLEELLSGIMICKVMH